MSRNNGNITKEKKELLKKADAILGEFELAREDLEESSKKFGKNLLIIASIGLGLAYTYKLISGDENDDEIKRSVEKQEKKHKKNYSRFGSSFKAIAIPFLLGIAKNVVLPDLNNLKKNGNRENT